MMNKENLRVLEDLISIMEMRDPNLNGHSLHIEKLSLLFYDSLPVSLKMRAKRSDLAYAALLHDIGQVGVQISTISKAGKLSEEERDQVRHHPEISEELLIHMNAYPKIRPGVRFHHERMDGKGYCRLSSEAIPFISKILAIVDSFSAVTMLKSYKPARTYEDGITELKLGAGTQFDKRLVDIFLSIPKHRVMACADEVREQLQGLEQIITRSGGNEYE